MQVYFIFSKGEGSIIPSHNFKGGSSGDMNSQA